MRRRGLCVAVLSACLLAMIAESAVIRRWRNKALQRQDAEDGDGDPAQANADQLTPRPKPRKGFRATHSRCCKIGEKVAKRKLSCDVHILEVVRQYNDMQRAKLKYNRPRKIIHSKISAKLSKKLRKCSASFPKYFEKCCKYREQFYKSMTKCKQRHGKERRTCRQAVRKRYKSPSSSRKKQRKQRKRKPAKQ